MRTSFLVLAALVALVARTPAQNPPSAPPGPPGLNEAPDTAGLGLSADQKTKFMAIRNDLIQKNAPLRQQAQQIMGGKTFRDLTPEEREAMRPKLQPIMQQIRENFHTAREQLEALLTPEQKQKFEERMRQRMQRRGMPGAPPSN
jgi:Spy/CpxP family protein refolding chaperone